ncbi:MAG TPA: hypothetical protein VN228_11275 [Pyrinomonadaceae bacterium]|nr:hypothetical protein [Pyrinomonadaceae bacterium]
MKRIMFPREVLLVEVERRCAGEVCGARARVALTKEEARAYAGFECERCGRWNADELTERDIPEWWEELKITALDGVRPVRPGGGAGDETPDAVWRLSEAWGRLRAAEGEDEGEAGS